MKKIKTIFWDWNGTLLNDVYECIEIINICLAKRSLKPLTLQEYLEKFEFPVKKYYENIGFDFSVESFESAGQEYIDAYSRRMFDCALHHGVENALEAARKTGARQFILSALNHDALLLCIERFRLGKFFDQVRGLSDSYAHSKIELGRHLLKDSACEKESAIMVGDTVHDFETAAAMGIDCVLLAAGHNSRKRLEKCGVPVFNCLAEFGNYLTSQA